MAPVDGEAVEFVDQVSSGDVALDQAAEAFTGAPRSCKGCAPASRDKEQRLAFALFVRPDARWLDQIGRATIRAHNSAAI
jgi:hypothetical protein